MDGKEILSSPPQTPTESELVSSGLYLDRIEARGQDFPWELTSLSGSCEGWSRWPFSHCVGSPRCSFDPPAALSLRTCSLPVTNDCHLHGQSCKRPFLWLLQAAPGLERQHLQGVVQRVPGFLCHVHSHQHLLQVSQQKECFRKLTDTFIKSVFHFCTLFFFFVRFLLHDDQKRYFEKLAIYCNHYASLIPMSFVLGKIYHLLSSYWGKLSASGLCL